MSLRVRNERGNRELCMTALYSMRLPLRLLADRNDMGFRLLFRGYKYKVFILSR